MRKVLLGGFLGIMITIAGLALGGSGQARAASGCDDYAIMRCGATTPAQFINKARQNAPGDLPAIYSNFGLAPSEYGKFATSAKQGTIRSNGDIIVDGAVVGRSTLNVGRIHDSNFNQRVSVNGKDYWGGPFGSTYHANQADVMVMFNDQGVMQFAVVSSCGNPQRITPNKPQYSCNSLRKTKVNGTHNTYSFTTAASAANGAQVVKAVYDFGDGVTKTVTDLSQPVQHSFKKDSTVRVTVYVRVPGGNVVTTTGADCVTQIKFQAPPTPTPTAQCTGLQATLLNQTRRNYKFVATAQFSSGVTLTGGDFNFGDGVVMRGLQANGQQVSVRHAYDKPGNYAITATLHFKAADGRTATADCETTISPAVSECKPGVPLGSPECQTNITTTSACVPTGKGDNCELTNTGPGTGTIVAAIFGGTSILGGLGHYLLRRRLLA